MQKLVIFWSGRKTKQDFPGGLVIKNPPANAGDTDSIPDPGRPHMPRGNQARAQLLSPHTRSLSSATRQDAAVRSPTPPPRAAPALRS